MRVLCIHQMDDSSLCTLERPVLERGHELVPWHAHREAPPPLDGFGAVIALGGTTHPDQEAIAPWLLPELELLRRLADAGVPTLGICLGAQLVARAHGAPVAPLARPEIGWFPVAREPADDPLLDGLPATFPAFQWHHYGFGVPDGAVRLAGSAKAPNQAVRVGRSSWALQFHIEVDRATAEAWIRDGGDELAAHGVDVGAMLADTQRHGAVYEERALALSHRFLAIAEHEVPAS